MMVTENWETKEEHRSFTNKFDNIYKNSLRFTTFLEIYSLKGVIKNLFSKEWYFCPALDGNWSSVDIRISIKSRKMVVPCVYNLYWVWSVLKRLNPSVSSAFFFFNKRRGTV